MAQNRKQLDRLVAEVAAGTTVTDAAELAGYSRRTAVRKLQDPDVQAAIQRARGEMLTAATARLVKIAKAAVSALDDLLDENTKPMIRLSAARIALDAALKFQAAVDVEDRLTAIEEQLRAQQDDTAQQN